MREVESEDDKLCANQAFFLSEDFDCQGIATISRVHPLSWQRRLTNQHRHPQRYPTSYTKQTFSQLPHNVETLLQVVTGLLLLALFETECPSYSTEHIVNQSERNYYLCSKSYQ